MKTFFNYVYIKYSFNLYSRIHSKYIQETNETLKKFEKRKTFKKEV